MVDYYNYLGIPEGFSTISTYPQTLVQTIEVLDNGHTSLPHFVGNQLEIVGNTTKSTTTLSHYASAFTDALGETVPVLGYTPVTTLAATLAVLGVVIADDSTTSTFVELDSIIIDDSPTSPLDVSTALPGNSSDHGKKSSSKNAGDVSGVSTWGVAILCLMFLGLV